ncbi:beta strand repeat-containing protein [Algoriphagus lacus]|uniref:beta strand repeat-containing protein n=1 Tax=Algoriphagus lacus TaxID=2056311 RepID=UPI001314FEFF|nr:T9SS type A sorting domain-containing protein [Algoriphagus lacus]
MFQFIFKVSPMLLGLGLVLGFQSNVLGQSQTYNSSGTFTVPHKITSVQVQIWGAGGGGGFVDSNRGGGGGGGGAYLQVNSFPVSPGTISVTVGAGGNGQSLTFTGVGTGGNSSFGALSANGGTGANGLNGGTGGAAAASGDIRTAGFSGISASNSGNSAGGNGGNGANSTGTGGAGGPTSSGVGQPGTQPGGGGGGEGANGANGGRGGDGRVIVSWTCSNTLTSGVGTNNQTICQGTGISNITYVIAGATGATVTGLPAGVTANYVDGDLTISGNPATPGTYNYSITPTGSCTSSTATGTITVTANKAVSAASSVPTLCINTPLSAITHTTTSISGIGVGPTGLPPGVTVGLSGNTLTISGTPTASGTFNYSIPLTGATCGPDVSATGTIIVNPDKTVGGASSSPTLCINSPLTAITHSTTNATGIGVPTGLPSGVTASFNLATQTITISGTPTVSGPFNYSIPVLGCGPAVSATGTITVTPDKAVSVASSAPTLCINTPLSAITHTTTSISGIGVGPTGLPPGVTVGLSGNTLTISGTPTASGTFNYSIPLTGATCGPDVSATGTIIVNPDKTVGGASSSPTLCINSPLTAITHSTTNATGIGVPTGLPSGVTASFNLATQTITISGTPTVSGPFNYSIPVLGCGPAVSATGTITVNPNNTVSAPSANPTVCVNAAITPITHTTTGTTGIGAATGLPTGLSASWASNTITISGTPTQTGTFNYTIPLTGGCGTVNATGTITVHAQAAIISPSLGAQVRCINTAFAPISVGTGFGLTYQWYSNTTASNSGGALIGSATSNTFTPPSNVAGTTYYYVVVTSATCGTTATSAPSGAFVVNPLPVVTFSSQPAVGDYCVDTDLTYTTQSGQSNYIWSIPGTAGTEYTIISGGTSTSNTVVIRWLTAGPKSISVNYTDTNGCGTPTAAISNSITVRKNTVTASSDPHPSSCFINRTITPFTHTTTLANGIGTPVGLPTGISASFSGNTITISGTVDGSVLPGVYPYTIPLTGGCGTVSASGFIDVQPEYALTKITSVSPSNTGGNATITLTGNPSLFADGPYVVNYQMGLANPLSATNTTVNFVNGVGQFFSSTINNESLTSLTVNSIRKVTDDCPVDLTVNNITFFGIQPKIYNTNGTFFVPAGIYQITVKVYGGGGGGGSGSHGAGGGGGGYSERTINVVPGEPIAIFVGNGGNGQTGTTAAQTGQPSYVTRDSNHPNPVASSLAYAYGGIGATGGTPGLGGVGQTTNGNPGNNPTGSAGGQGGKGGGVDGGVGGAGGVSGNVAARRGKAGLPFGGGGGGSHSNADGGNGAGGYVIITYPLPPVDSCFVVIDDGSISGFTVIEYLCDDVWEAPEGLSEFTVYVGSGGGGGGGGEGSGGGGSGSLIVQTINSPFPGFPAGTTYTIGVGQGGAGAPGIDQPGSAGEPSTFSGTGVNINVPGGGGGGSSQQNPGGDGASGGGGGASPAPDKSFGVGGSVIPITYTGPSVIVYQGNVGGLGDYSEPQNSVAGGGGGGLVPWGSGNDGQNGKAAGNGQGEGGRGGDGIALILGDSVRYYGGGGGGIGEFFNGTEKIGEGGIAVDPNTGVSVKLGGDGNLNILNTTGLGLPGRDKTGSGGGAGYNGGGKGGNGVVYIVYFNVRILGVELQEFTANYSSDNRTGKLKWSTAKERGNSHFEIERAVGDTKTWTKIGEVAGKGYSDSPVEYSFDDLELPAGGGNIFYRLKQVSLNGQYEYSVTRAIQVHPVDGSSTWVVYPNPSSSGSNVKVELLQKSSYREEPVQVMISDIRGIAEIYSGAKPEEVSNLVNNYLEKARPGVYILQLVWGDRTEQHKLLRR